MEEGKDYLKPLDNSCNSETDTSLTLLTATVATDVAADINLGSLSDMADTLNATDVHTVTEDSTDHQIKVDGNFNVVLSNL
jgi:hypothetical protein